MKILILGGDGMLGHRLAAAWGARHDVAVTLRQPRAAYANLGPPAREGTFDGIDATADDGRLEAVIAHVAPDAVVNAIGLVKQRPDASDAIPAITLNALLPHRLLALCRRHGARLVHVSTDCVFSGRRGGYQETDVPDPVDLYGRSKLLGEVHEPPGLTVRTSIIGLELGRHHGLVEWFLRQRGLVRGFRRAIYTGLTAAELARVIERVLERSPDLFGVWHVASAPISKYALLLDLAARMGRTDIEIVPDDALVCDRSLVSDRFTAATGYRAPDWDSMLAELAAEIGDRERGRLEASTRE